MSKSRSIETEPPITKKVAVKYDGEKIRYELVPIRPLEEVAKLYTVGAKKYGDRNWENGFKWTRCIAAAMRHLFEFCKGEDYDKESGCHHLAAVVFYCFALIEFSETHPEMDDRDKRSTSKNAMDWAKDVG